MLRSIVIGSFVLGCWAAHIDAPFYLLMGMIWFYAWGVFVFYTSARARQD